MGHAWMPLEEHMGDCAKNVGDVHTLYIRTGPSPYNQKFKRIGVVCSACYRMKVDETWIQENEENYETIRQKIPKSKTRLLTRRIVKFDTLSK